MNPISESNFFCGFPIGPLVNHESDGHLQTGWQWPIDRLWKWCVASWRWLEFWWPPRTSKALPAAKDGLRILGSFGHDENQEAYAKTDGFQQERPISWFYCIFACFSNSQNTKHQLRIQTKYAIDEVSKNSILLTTAEHFFMKCSLNLNGHFVSTRLWTGRSTTEKSPWEADDFPGFGCW